MLSRNCTSFLILTLGIAIPIAFGAPKVSELRPISPSTLAQTAEFAFDVKGEYENPFDPDQIRVDAEITGPDGRSWTAPAFWMEPHAMRTEAASSRFSRLTFVQFFIGASQFPRGKPVRFAFSDMALVNSETGNRRELPEWIDPATWNCPGNVSMAPGRTPNGKLSLIVTILPDGTGYPGIRLTPKGALADWSAFDTLTFQATPLAGLKGYSLRLEIREGTRKSSVAVFRGSRPRRDWAQNSWRYDRQIPSISWRPAGKGEWRLRLAAPTTGEYRIALKATDKTGATTASWSVHLDRTSEHGFIRVAPECPRYLRCDSGEPFFSVGSNLLVFNDNFGEYVYYIDKFAGVGVNLFRVWLDNPRLGFEKHKLGRYEQKECAVLDALLNHANRRRAAIMLCLLDFREVAEKRNLDTGGWERNPYHTICGSATEFFTDAHARQAFRKRLRYLVARWGASPVVHSWEFFNEVNITDAWRRSGKADTVRAWHVEMAEFLRAVDPYDHILTTSLSSREDDPLWSQPLMEIVQPHCYQTAAVDFASFIRLPCLALARHGKPVLPGEFGLMTVKYEDVVEGGVSIHNGLWASMMSGCCGTAMPWWWDWIDRHGYYHQFRGAAKFAKDIHWHGQAFVPIPDAELKVVVPEAAESAPGTVMLEMERHTWDAAAPYNQPARVEVRKDGSTQPAGRLSTRLHGLRNHRDCHNPKTFVVDYPLAGRFVVSVESVSGHGGANLHICVDGQEKLFRDFVDEDEQLKNVMQEYRGDYAVDVPPGKHEIRIENTGNDWLTLSRIGLENYGWQPSSVQVMGLRGRDTVLLWLRNRDYTWFGNMAKQPCRTIEGAALAVGGMQHGRHTVRLFDPQTASWVGEVQQCEAHLGVIRLDLPPLRHDLAIVVAGRAGGG